MSDERYNRGTGKEKSKDIIFIGREINGMFIPNSNCYYKIWF